MGGDGSALVGLAVLLLLAGAVVYVLVALGAVVIVGAALYFVFLGLLWLLRKVGERRAEHSKPTP